MYVSRDDSTYSSNRLLCAVYTMEENHDAVITIANSWGSKCDGFLAFRYPVCMHVCKYLSMYICIFVWIVNLCIVDVCIVKVFICMFVYVCIVSMYVCIYYVCIVYVCMYVCMYVCIRRRFCAQDLKCMYVMYLWQRSTKEDMTVPAVSIPHGGAESYDNMWQKIVSIVTYIHSQYSREFEWW